MRVRNVWRSDVSRELHAGILAEAADDVVDRALRQPPPAAADEQRPLALRRLRFGVP